jgi:tetratricopeptide (TPR) repeat protein
VGIDWLKLARCSGKGGDLRLALRQIDHAIEIFDQALRPNHPTRIQAANYKAEFLIELDRRDEARRLLDSFTGIETPGLDTQRSLLAGQVILAEIEGLDGQWPKSQALAEHILADPAIHGDRLLEGSARWARACALAMQNEKAEAGRERTRALEIEMSGAEQMPFPGVFALAKSYACAGESARALATLRAAAAKGFDDPSVMHDPAFAAVRQLPDFAAIAAAIGPRALPASPAAR